MSNYFITSFAQAENENYVWRFHGDLTRAVRELSGHEIDTEICRGGQGAANSDLVAETGVLVALCSPDYYTDPGCGRDWALFQHRLHLIPPQRGTAHPASPVLVRWLPAEPPADLPWAPVLADPHDAYARKGLFDIIDNLGWNSEEYATALQELAARVCAGHKNRPPDLAPASRPVLPAAFPRPRAGQPPTPVPAPRAPASVLAPRTPAPAEGTGAPRVFFSYAHEENDGGVHARRVRALNDRLSEEGVDVILDQTRARGPQFWPRWMGEQYRQANFILVIASPTYKRRAHHKEDPGVGDGVAFEADYILQQRYHDRNWYRRILLVIFPGYSYADLPDFLGEGSVSYYEIDPDTGEGLPDLLDHILGGPTA
ncbi:TIR domain-containing protein [Streptomyces sp. NBC_00663]|uniref:TIR domain-containing protein n=1 Tax=Streptomyces sp. NBC_00663 TaxID=2975801 RepID=UPI002E36AA80|nr:TIR domain-containing protein [Streptomyces sp. NBC_00663]